MGVPRNIAEWQGPLEDELLSILNKETVTQAEVRTLVEALLNACRQDVMYHASFRGRILPSNQTQL